MYFILFLFHGDQKKKKRKREMRKRNTFNEKERESYI